MVSAHWNEDIVNINTIYHISLSQQYGSGFYEATCHSTFVDLATVNAELFGPGAVSLSALSGTRDIILVRKTIP